MDLVGAVLPEPPLCLPPERYAGEPNDLPELGELVDPPEPVPSIDPWVDEVAGWVPGEPSWQVTDLLPDPVQDPGVVAGREFGVEWPPPVLLDGTGPGPLLASLAAEADLGSCSDDLVVGVASAASRLQAWAAALEAAATAELVARAGRWRGVTPAGQPIRKNTVAAERIAAAELSCALGVSERSAQNRVALALDLQRLPETSAALAAGRLHHYTARLVVDTLRPLPDEAAARVEAAVLPRYSGRSFTDLSRALRRAVLAVDPQAGEKRRAEGAEDRTVETYPMADGMATATMTGPAEDVEAFFTWLTGGAEAAKGPGDVRTLAQRRFDVLADLAHTGLAYDTTRPDRLIHQWRAPTDTTSTTSTTSTDGAIGAGTGTDGAIGPGASRVGEAGTRLRTRQGRRPTIHVTVSVETLLGLRDDPGELAGYGPITAQVARRIATEGTWRRLLTDPRTGRFDELSVDSYQPPQDMRDHVLARDPVCIGLGCRLPANRCDLDHRVPHPRGPTAAGNLEPWCRSGHEIKTFTDTTVTTDPDDPEDPADLTGVDGRDGPGGGAGGRVITYPSGRSYRLPVEPVLEDFGLDTEPASPNAQDNDPPRFVAGAAHDDPVSHDPLRVNPVSDDLISDGPSRVDPDLEMPPF